MNRPELIYQLCMIRGKKPVVRRYGNAFWQTFRRDSRALVMDVIGSMPDIGDSMFRFNYEFAPSYIAWYKTLEAMNVPIEEIQRFFWDVHERLMALIPSPFIPLVRRIYLGSFRKKAPEHQRKSEQGLLPAYDWNIRFRAVDENTFEIDYLDCGIMKLCRDHNAMGVFPFVCRLDYLFAHYMRHSFERTMTLGDGDSCCNCRYSMKGACEWRPDKGFGNRK